MPSFRAQLTEQEYVNVVNAVAKPSARTILILTVASGLVVVAAIVAWRSGYTRESVVGMGVWFGGWAGGEIGRRLSVPPKARRVFRQLKTLQRPHDVTWDNAGVSITGEEGHVVTPWAEFHKYRETADHFILFLSEVTFYMLPKRAFSNSAEVQDFSQLVRNRVRRG